MTVERFVDDDQGFLVWRNRHWNGFIVNCNRNPSPSYLVLHKSDCDSLARHDNYTTKDYIKVCSDSPAELGRWAREEVGGELHLDARQRRGDGPHGRTGGGGAARGRRAYRTRSAAPRQLGRARCAELASAGIPTGMLFVRSTGGSHNPREHADAEDAALGVQVLLLASELLLASGSDAA